MSSAEDFLMVLHCPQAIKVLLFGHGASMDNRKAPLVFPCTRYARSAARLAPPGLIEFPCCCCCCVW